MSRFDWDRVKREDRIARARRAEERLLEELGEAILLRRSLVNGREQPEPASRDSTPTGASREAWVLDMRRMRPVTVGSWDFFAEAVSFHADQLRRATVLAVQGVEPEMLLLADVTSRPLLAVRRSHADDPLQFEGATFRSTKQLPLAGWWWLMGFDETATLGLAAADVARRVWGTPHPESLLYDIIRMAPAPGTA